MDKNEANELRATAAAIIHSLWRAGETTQLELLMVQAKRSIEEPYSEDRHGEHHS